VPEDRLSPREFAAAVTAISSAFGDPTRRDIYLAVQEQEGGMTATQVAAAFGLHANVARHHLDKLAGGGYLEVGVDRDRGGGAGRPSKRYRARNDGAPLEVPVRHDDVLITLLGRALSSLPPAEAERMAEEVGEEYGRTMAAAMGDIVEGQRSFRAALHAVADALTSHGFAAHAEKHGTELRIVSENCPFGGVAVEHPVVCAVDRGMVKGMLGALYGPSGAATESSLPKGDEVCVTAVSH